MSGEEIGVAEDPGGYRSYEGWGNDLLVGTAEQQHQHYRSVEEDALDTMLETTVNELDEALKMGSIANYGTASTTMPAIMAVVDTANEPAVVGGGRVVWALQPESPTTPSFPPPPSPLSTSLNRMRTTTTTKIEFLSSKNEPCQSVLLHASPLSSRPHVDDQAEVARFPAAAPLVPTISPSPAVASTVESKKSAATSSVAAPRSGRWTLDEKVLFLYGLQKYGRGKWKYIQSYCPGRSLVQIKSHAQKVFKRIEAGDNVFRKMEEHCSRLRYLVDEIHKGNHHNIRPTSPLSPPQPKNSEHILVASALCQLGDNNAAAATD